MKIFPKHRHIIQESWLTMVESTRMKSCMTNTMVESTCVKMFHDSLFETGNKQNRLGSKS